MTTSTPPPMYEARPIPDHLGKHMALIVAEHLVLARKTSAPLRDLDRHLQAAGWPLSDVRGAVNFLFEHGLIWALGQTDAGAVVLEFDRERLAGFALSGEVEP